MEPIERANYLLLLALLSPLFYLIFVTLSPETIDSVR